MSADVTMSNRATKNQPKTGKLTDGGGRQNMHHFIDLVLRLMKELKGHSYGPGLGKQTGF